MRGIPRSRWIALALATAGLAAGCRGGPPEPRTAGRAAEASGPSGGAAAPEEASWCPGLSWTPGPGDRMICAIESRAHRVTVYSTARGLRYTVIGADGRTVSAGLDPETFQARYPHLYNRVRSGLAASGAEAGAEPAGLLDASTAGLEPAGRGPAGQVAERGGR